MKRLLFLIAFGSTSLYSAGPVNSNPAPAVKLSGEAAPQWEEPSISEEEKFLTTVIQDNENKRGLRHGFYQKDYAATEEDRQLNQRIRERLSGWFTSNYNETIVLRTSSGNVTLEGVVDHPEEIQQIIDALWKVPGVNHITNRLTARRASVPV